MNDEPKRSGLSKNLDERFARYPEMYERMQRIADQLEESIERGMSADEAEQIAIVQLQELGRAWLTDWAQARHDRSVAAVQREIPRAIKQRKKN